MPSCLVLHPADLAPAMRLAWIALLERAEYGSPLPHPDFAISVWPGKAALVSAPGGAHSETALRSALRNTGEDSLRVPAPKTASTHRSADQIAAAGLDPGGRLSSALRTLTPVRTHQQEDAA